VGLPQALAIASLPAVAEPGPGPAKRFLPVA
jgi:hypothetical protein